VGRVRQVGQNMMFVPDLSYRSHPNHPARQPRQPRQPRQIAHSITSKRLS